LRRCTSTRYGLDVEAELNQDDVRYADVKEKLMQVQTFQMQVNVPDVNDFAAEYPQYGPKARNDGQFLFDLIMTPESFVNARAAVVNHDLPAVSGVAKTCYDAVQAQMAVQWDGYLKQFIGAVVSTLVVANGFKKTESKKAVPHHAFTKAEMHTL
jgi:hypothetical protein